LKRTPNPGLLNPILWSGFRIYKSHGIRIRTWIPLVSFQRLLFLIISGEADSSEHGSPDEGYQDEASQGNPTARAEADKNDALHFWNLSTHIFARSARKTGEGNVGSLKGGYRDVWYFSLFRSHDK
jgi:hypothetical protein